MLIRQLLHACPPLRHNLGRDYRVSIGTHPVAHYERLFGKTSDFNQHFCNHLVQGMACMHLHHVFHHQDTLHQSSASFLKAAARDPALQLHYLFFFMAFMFLPQFITSVKKLRECATMDPEAFAEWCWKKRVIPVSPRFGQGDRAKSWYKQLLSHAANNETAFKELITRIHTERVLDYRVCSALAATLQLPAQGQNPCIQIAGPRRPRAP